MSFFEPLVGFRTNDPEITNHVLWPTELKRRVGKLAISRRYNQLPLLRSSPGGFEGSWPYRTYPFSFCGCKGRHYFEICNSLRRFFYCFFRFSILSLFTAPYTDTLEGRYGFFPALRWTNIPFTKKYSSDSC